MVAKIFLGASPPDPLSLPHFLAPHSKICSAVPASPWHLCHCLHCQRLKYVLGIPKTSMDEIFIGTYSYKLGTSTPTFGTRFHHICTMLYHPSSTMVPLPCRPFTLGNLLEICGGNILISGLFSKWQHFDSLRKNAQKILRKIKIIVNLELLEEN